MCIQIIKYGGNLQAIYDPKMITHIVTPDKPSLPVTLRALGLNKMGDIPNKVSTVTWSWIVDGHGVRVYIVLGIELRL